MKIAHVIDYFQPKLGYQETFLAREHALMGHETCVITSERYAPLLYETGAVKKVLGERIKAPGVFEEEGIKTFRQGTLFEMPHGIWLKGLGKRLLEQKPDLVIAHGVSNFSTIRIALLKLRKGNFKLVIDDHMTFGASRSLWKVLYPVFRVMFSPLILKEADALVGVSNTSKAFMHKAYGFPIKSVDMIPLGADRRIFTFNGEARASIRKEYGVRDGDTLFIYAGKLIPEKGPHIMVEAAIRLAGRRDDVRFIMLGNGQKEYVDDMKRNLESRQISPRFIWHDAVPNGELYRYYSAADVAVWPKEASLSMMEAMSCGLPVIISSGSEVMERLEFDNGLTYAEGNPADLEMRMESLVDRNLSRSMGERGKKLVEEKLGWDIIARRFLQAAGETT